MVSENLKERLLSERGLIPIAVAGAFICAGLVVSVVQGIDPLTFFWLLFKNSFTNPASIVEGLARSTPILLTGVAFALPLKGNYVNVGVEGQMVLGALASAGVGILLMGQNLPKIVGIPISLAAGAVTGAVYSFIPAYFKVKYNVNEVVGTILLNFIALKIVLAMIQGPWAGTSPLSAGLVMTDYFPSSITLPRIASPRLHIGFIIAIGVTVLLYILARKTLFGYNLRCVGTAPKTATYAGIDKKRTLLLTSLISGAVAGIAGTGEVTGYQTFMRPDFSPGFGFLGLTIAFLARSNIPITAIGAILFGIITIGARGMRLQLGVSYPIISLIQGLLLAFAVIAWGIPRWRRRR